MLRRMYVCSSVTTVYLRFIQQRGWICCVCVCVWGALCWCVRACARCWCVCVCEVHYVDVCVWGALCCCVRARCWCAQAGVLALMLAVLSLRFVAIPSSGFIIPSLLFHTMKYVGCFLLFSRLVFLPRFGLKPFMNSCHPKYKHSLSLVFWHYLALSKLCIIFFQRQQWQCNNEGFATGRAAERCV